MPPKITGPAAAAQGRPTRPFLARWLVFSTGSLVTVPACRLYGHPAHRQLSPVARVAGRMTSSERKWSVAAVIPTYNRAALLARAIDSVLAQRRPPDEIIVVDDGSSDNTEEVVGAYGDALILVQKRNGGVSSARNAGVKESRADFIAFLDSDDLWYDEHLSRIADAIGRTEGARDSLL